VLEPIHVENVVTCPACGAATERAWLTKPPNAQVDECDIVSRNGERHPIRFRSKSDHRRWLKEKGYVINDNASHHSATGGKQWLEDAETLVKRNGEAPGSVVADGPEAHMRLTFSSGELTKAQAAEYARRNR